MSGLAERETAAISGRPSRCEPAASRREPGGSSFLAGALDRSAVLLLQQTIGNRAVTRVIAREKSSAAVSASGPEPPAERPGTAGVPHLPAEPMSVEPAAMASAAFVVCTPLDIPAEGVDMPWVGKGVGVSSSDLGYLRDFNYFWSRFQAAHGSGISPDNARRIANGVAPVVDETWVARYPGHAGYMGDTLEHHHLGQGSRAVPLPSRLHDAYTVFHPQRRVVGTQQGGTRPIPPARTAAQAQEELERHVKAGRIRGPGIDPEAPPKARAVPPASELSGMRPPARLGAYLRNVGPSAALAGLDLLGAYFSAEIQASYDEKRWQKDRTRITGEVGTELERVSGAVGDMYVAQPDVKVHCVVSLRSKTVRNVVPSPPDPSGQVHMVDNTVYWGTELVGVRLGRQAETGHSEKWEKTAPLLGLLGQQEITTTDTIYSFEVPEPDTEALTAHVMGRLIEIDLEAQASLTAEAAVALSKRRARLLEWLRERSMKVTRAGGKK